MEQQDIIMERNAERKERLLDIAERIGYDTAISRLQQKLSENQAALTKQNVPLFGQGGELGGDVLLLVLLPVYLIEPFEAYLRILQLLCEPDERRDRAVELPDDVGQRHHHAQGHLSVYHRHSS